VPTGPNRPGRAQARAAATATSRPPGASASQPRAASSFSLDRRPPAFAFFVSRPDAAANSTARSGRPASAATSSRSWCSRGSTDASEPSCHGGTVRTRETGLVFPACLPFCPSGGSAGGRLFHDPGDLLPRDRQPRGLLLRPGQVPRKLLDPAAQPARLGPRACLPPAEFLGQRARPGLLPPEHDGRRPARYPAKPPGVRPARMRTGTCSMKGACGATARPIPAAKPARWSGDGSFWAPSAE
jgi:hypothetical protein